MSRNELYTPKQYDVMLYLFKVRGATIFQILNYINSGYDKPIIKSHKNRMYELLGRLKIKNIVTNTEVGQRKASMYHLTQHGLELMYEELEIESHKIGRGFNKDYGFFPYPIYKPPTKAVKHFLNQTDVHTIVLNLQKMKPGIYDYRDNLYGKTTYEYPEGKKIIKGTYKPDGELQIDDDYYFIEVDRQTERNLGLDLKFANLRQYLRYLNKANIRAPKGVIFIREEALRKGNSPYVWSMKTRYNSLFTSFQKECKAYTESIDLFYYEIPNLTTGLIELLQENKISKKNQLIKLVNQFVKENQTNIRSISIAKHEEFVLLQIQEVDKKELYIFAPMEGYESRSWQKGLSFYQTQKENYTDIFFIPFYQQLHTVAPESPFDKKVTTKEELEFYTHVYHLNIKNLEKPLWFDHEHTSLVDNPLLPLG